MVSFQVADKGPTLIFQHARSCKFPTSLRIYGKSSVASGCGVQGTLLMHRDAARSQEL